MCDVIIGLCGVVSVVVAGFMVRMLYVLDLQPVQRSGAVAEFMVRMLYVLDLLVPCH